MKYETPKLTALTPAINAVQATKNPLEPGEIHTVEEVPVGAYADWE